MRLDRVLCERGIESRKSARTLVRQGRVTVEGVVVKQAAQHIDINAVVTVDARVFAVLPMMLAWHKPVGVICTTKDPWGRRSLAEALPPQWRGRFHPVGRLDADTSGLLLFSRDGDLTHRLLHPRQAVPRTYRATVLNEIQSDLKARLAAGVTTALGTFPADLLAVDGQMLTLTVREGKHRMVRRMLNNAGHPVQTLMRMSFGPIELGDLESEAFWPVPAAVVAQISTGAAGQ